MKRHLLATLLLALALTACAEEPLLSTWLTEHSTRYARIYASEADRRAGRTSTTWSNRHQEQALPAYVGVQEISYSADWVYIRTTGLGAHVMGPWFDDPAQRRPFINLPQNQQRLFRFPRRPEAAQRVSPVRGDIGLFVDGVHAFDSSDAVSYSAAEKRDGDPPGHPGGVRGDHVWNRDAFVNEAHTFDGAMAHQQNTGDYHYHATPVAPRYQLGDHVEYDRATGRFVESTAPVTRHSPIVGWAKDGYPIYGPYGYGEPQRAGSPVRRMVSGFALRDGRAGTTDLRRTGRQSLPAWAQRLQASRPHRAASAEGPKVSTDFPLGRYLEDHEYLGDLGQKQGRDFDLDEHNGRFCVTPEFPGGTYAYFSTITAEGQPAFPYNVGRTYYGVPTGGEVRGSLEEPVTVVFRGGPAITERTLAAQEPQSSAVTLTWQSVEGGTYRVESTGPRPTTVAEVKAAPAATQTSVQLPAKTDASQLTVKRTALAPYESVEPSAESSRVSQRGPRGGGGPEGRRGPGAQGGPGEREGFGSPGGQSGFGERDNFGPPRGGPGGGGGRGPRGERDGERGPGGPQRPGGPTGPEESGGDFAREDGFAQQPQPQPSGLGGLGPIGTNSRLGSTGGLNRPAYGATQGGGGGRSRGGQRGRGGQQRRGPEFAQRGGEGAPEMFPR